MYKMLIPLLGFTVIGTVSAETNSEPVLTAQNLNSLAIEDQRLIKASFPELINNDNANRAAKVATIGGDGGCYFNSSLRTTPIQDAIDSGGAYTELRIVEGTYNEDSITLVDRDMIIKGGYASCADAANDIKTSPDSLATIIQPTAELPAFRIQGNSTHNKVHMHNLRIRNSGSNSLWGGALRIHSADATISLNHVALSGNEGLKGGAIAVVGYQGAPSVILNSVQINDNTAEEGGGIFCHNPNGMITQNSSNGQTHGIYLNEATEGDGGGVLVENGCSFTSYQGSKNVGLFSGEYRGIRLNFANQNGGGIAVRGGSKANLIGRSSCMPFFGGYLCLNGNNTEPVTVSLNFSDYNKNGIGNGGGVYVTDAGSELLAENAYFWNNISYNHGGAVAIQNKSKAFITSAYENQAGPIDCWQPGACLDFDSNKADSFGGAFYVNTGAELALANAQVQGSRSNLAVAGYVAHSDSVLNIEGGYIFNNGDSGKGDYLDRHVFRTFDSAHLNLAYVTVADNKQDNVVIANNNSSVKIGSSIVHDNRASAPNIYFQEGASPLSSFDCIMAHEDTTLSDGFMISALDPVFVDRDNHDFHLTAQSPAIDYCDDVITPANYKDMDGDERGWKHPGAPTVIGLFDLGGDERHFIDLIFKDGFE